jgi:hypothetical protein
LPWVGAGSGVDTETLLAVRDGITSALDSINVTTRIFSPTELIRFIDDVVCPPPARAMTRPITARSIRSTSSAFAAISSPASRKTG